MDSGFVGRYRSSRSNDTVLKASSILARRSSEGIGFNAPEMDVILSNRPISVSRNVFCSSVNESRIELYTFSVTVHNPVSDGAFHPDRLIDGFMASDGGLNSDLKYLNVFWRRSFWSTARTTSIDDKRSKIVTLFEPAYIPKNDRCHASVLEQAVASKTPTEETKSRRCVLKGAVLLVRVLHGKEMQ